MLGQQRLYAVASIVLMWTFSLRLCHCYITNCDYIKSYTEVVTVDVKEPVHIIQYKWCFNIPPRCPDNKDEIRTVKKNTTVIKLRIEKQCCKYQYQLYDECVKRCTEDQCPNIQCLPNTNKCTCKPGYEGILCKQECSYGFWGDGCKNLCNEACPECDHQTGCCKTPVSNERTTVVGLTLCATEPIATASRRLSDNLNDTANRDNDEMDHSNSTQNQMQNSQSKTWKPAAAITDTTQGEIRKPAVITERQSAIVKNNETEEGSLSPPSSTKGNNENQMTTMENNNNLYNYDNLAMKLIWITAMSIVAIAMVIVIMFIIFFNYVGTSKSNERTQSRQHGSMMAKNHDELCSDTQRYTKSPGLNAPRNDELPLQPEIFCPVFSASHYIEGSTLYDSPQPLYEILC